MTERGQGCYPDPSGQAPYRWWDGTRWTEHTVTEMGPTPTKRPVGLIVFGVIIALAAAVLALEGLPGDDGPTPVAAEDPTDLEPRQGDDGTAERALAVSIDGRDYQWIDRIEADGQLNVIITGQDADTVDAARRGVEADTAAALAAAFHDPGTDAERVWVRVDLPLTDEYGTTEARGVLEVLLDADTAGRINWAEPDAIRWPEVWVESYRHPHLNG